MDYSDLEDATLLELLKQDDEMAFKEIYVRFHDFLYHYAFRLTNGNKEESQDILQTLFLNLWNKRNEIHVSGKLFSYLYQSIQYGFLNQERSKSTFSRYSEDLRNYIGEGKATTEEYIFEKELEQRLRKIAEAMPGKGGEIFTLFYFDNYTHSEIAGILGISEKTTKNLLYKSTKDIRLKIGLSIVLLFLLNS